MFLLFGCGNKAPASKSIESDTLLYSYAPIYTGSFDTGKPAYAKKVLEIWKEFETGDIQHVNEYFSDSLTLIFPDSFLTGKRDSILYTFQKRRLAYQDVQCYIDAWLPLRAEDRNEELVVLWGRQDGTTKEGKRRYTVLHEIWRFDEKGKIKKMEQYITLPY